jgi:hypothetical protein
MIGGDLKTWLSELPSALEKELFVNKACRSEEIIRELLQLSLSEPDPVAWRAAWVLDGCDETGPPLPENLIHKIVRNLSGIKSTGVIRSYLRLLCRHDIEEEEQGLLVDLCFKYVASGCYPVAVKVHSLEIIYRHVLLYPELRDELTAVILSQIDHSNAGFKARGKKVLKQLEKLDNKDR